MMTSNTTLNKERTHNDACARISMPYFGVKIYYVGLEMYGHIYRLSQNQ